MLPLVKALFASSCGRLVTLRACLKNVVGQASTLRSTATEDGSRLPLGRLAPVFSRARRPLIAGRRPAPLFSIGALSGLLLATMSVCRADGVEPAAAEGGPGDQPVPPAQAPAAPIDLSTLMNLRVKGVSKFEQPVSGAPSSVT